MRRWHHHADCQRFWRKLSENRETQTGHASSRRSQSKCSQTESSRSTRAVSQERQSILDFKRWAVCKTHAALQVPYEIAFRGWEEGSQQVKNLLLECEDQNSNPQNYANTEQACNPLKIPALTGWDGDGKVGQGGQLAKSMSSWFSNRQMINQVESGRRQTPNVNVRITHKHPYTHANGLHTRTHTHIYTHKNVLHTTTHMQMGLHTHTLVPPCTHTQIHM